VATITGIEGLLAGRTLMNRYLVEEVIGRGGMGAVYRASDGKLGREVAVKVITVAAPDRVSHDRLRSRFHREARAAAALHHPCVVAVHDYGTDPQLGLDFIVMELLRGEDLASRLERLGPPAAATSLSILEQAARGLAAGHRAGLIHRDVKPGNLFLESGDRIGEVRVKVLDFGIAELSTAEGDTMTHLTIAGRSPFSPAYASPEQLRGEPRLSPATDVFSLGAVGFQLLTGRRLFSTSEPGQMLVELSRCFAEERRRLDSISPAATRALEKALAPSAADRFPNGAAFADALLPLLPGSASASTARPVPPGRSPTAAPASAPTDATELYVATTAATSSRGGDETELHEADPVEPAKLDARTRAAAVLERKPAPTPAPARGWLRRAASATFAFLLTTTATGLFAAAWFAAFLGLQGGDLEMVYAGAAGSIVATPLALHRLMGRRGMLSLGIFASIAVTFGCVYWLRDQRMEIVLGAVFAAQLAVCVLMERLTGGGRRLGTREVASGQEFPGVR
jgi:serine/threonine protein kinase